MRWFGVTLLFLLSVHRAGSAYADELRPAYLSVRETRPGEFSVLWKVPALGDKRLGLYLRLPDGCTSRSEPVRVLENAAYSERWTAICIGGLKGRPIAIDGLRSTTTDALARIEYRDGSVEIARLTPEVPRYVVVGVQSGWKVAWTYFLLGVDHILSGYDHLLFVFALMLLINELWMLAKAITAFTLAHSITLAGATLGYFSLPQKPVEATIALSIAFVASELIKQRPGEQRLSESYPWVVAFAFGLLHGFGFAGALRETGLPQTDVPVALLTFNVGVEAGQLFFVAFLWIALLAVRSFITLPAALARGAAAYVIGAVSMLWFVARIAGFGAGVLL
jgi:hydrogenase/urease accessory protein HupE